MNIKSSGPRGLSRVEFISLIAAIMSLNAMAIDIMLPALPYMAEALDIVRENDRQLVITSYVLGFGISQIVFGPLSDRYGRRAPLLIGLVVYILALFAAAIAPSFGALLFLRMLQGMGAAGTRVIAASIVRDCYSGRAMAEVMSLVFMVFMIMPIIAPAIGQVILFTGPWWVIFLFMGVLTSAISLWAFFRLPETLAVENRRPLSVSSVSAGFATVLTNRLAMSYSLAGMFMMGMMLGFVGTAQQVYVGLYGLGPLFPLAFAVTAGLMALSAFMNSRVVGRFGMRRISHLALLLFLATSFIWWIVSLFGPMSFWLFFLFLAIDMFMFSWVVANANSLSLEPLGKVAGTASAVFGSIQTVGGALLGLFIGQMFNGTLSPLAAGFTLMGVFALACVLFGEKGKLFGKGSDLV